MDAYFCIGYRDEGDKELTIIMEEYRDFSDVWQALEEKRTFQHITNNPGRRFAIIQYCVIFDPSKNPAP